MKPFFSIITCTYNSEKYILKNLHSVLVQDYRNYEHLIVDGLSKDNTVPLIKKYLKQNKNAKLYSLPPKGISNAFNKAISLAKGEYLFFLNSDDSFYDDKILSDVYSFLKNKNKDWIYGKINVVTEEGKKVGEFPTQRIFQYPFSNILKYLNFIPHQGVFMKKSIFKKFGNFDEELKVLMDYDLWLRISKKTDWKFYNRIIANYTIRSGATSSSKENRKLNRNTVELVRGKHLNPTEQIIAKAVNFLVEMYNKTYR